MGVSTVTGNREVITIELANPTGFEADGSGLAPRVVPEGRLDRLVSFAVKV